MRIGAWCHTGVGIDYRSYGDWRLVVQSLEKRLSRHPEFRGESRQIVERSINYLRNHGESGHMDYPKFALMGLP